MAKSNQLNQWRPLQINGTLLTGAEGLIGIEECTDYDLGTILLGKKALKRKINAAPDVKSNAKVRKPRRKVDATPDVELTETVKKPKVVGASVPNGQRRVDRDSLASQEIIDRDCLTPSKRGSTDHEFGLERRNNGKKTKSCRNKVDDTSTDDVIGRIDLASVKSWLNCGLAEPLLKALAFLKFTEPTQIQSLTLPAAIMGKRDILGAAETGSGKTLAFGLPILSGILKLREKENCTDNEISSDNKISAGEKLNEAIAERTETNSNESDFEETEESVEDLNVQGIGRVRSAGRIPMAGDEVRRPLHALILTPTRELAMQVKNHLVAAAKFTGIGVAVVVGGMAVEKQERILSKGPEIVVATPGRLWELIRQGNGHLSQVDNIKFLAIDETDRMIERGHFQELHHILERINLDEEKKRHRQNFVFSATLTLVHELPQHLLTKKKLKMRGRVSDMTPSQKLLKVIDTLGITDPKCVDITQGKGTSGTLTECRITCTIDEKDYYLYYFLQKHPGRTLVFCNSIGCVKRLATILGLLGCDPLPLHASMQQRQRLRNLDRFKEKENGLLIATDVAARGLDIPCVEHVIHYQTPRTSEGYVHRSGRTARATRDGITVLLVEPSELRSYLRVCRTLGKTEDIPTFPVQETLLNAVKQRVNLARELDKLELQLRKTNSEAGWLQKVADEMDMIVDDESHKYDRRESHGLKKAADFKRKELLSLLARPLFPKGFSGKYPLSSGDLNIPMVQGEQKIETAIEAMKSAFQNKAQVQRRKPRLLFKSKIKKSSEIVTSKLRNGNNEQRTKRGKRSNRKIKAR